MGIRIRTSLLPTSPAKREAIEVSGSTVGDCLSQLIKRFPEAEKVLFDEDRKLLAYIGIYVNGKDTYPQELARPVKDGDDILILTLISGGKELAESSSFLQHFGHK